MFHLRECNDKLREGERLGSPAELLDELVELELQAETTGKSELVPETVEVIGKVVMLDGAVARRRIDSGHAKLEREYDRWDEYLNRLGEKLLHVHLSENDGTADQHLPLGSAPRSKTNWPQHIQKLKATGYDGTITLEVFSPEKENLLLSRDLLRKWWDAAT